MTHQGYQVDKDLDPVSEFGGDDGSGRQLRLARQGADAGAPAARGRVHPGCPERGALGGPASFSDPSFKSVAIHAVPVSAGDEAHGSVVTIKLKNGKSVDEALVLLRRGTLVALVTAAVAGQVPPSAVTHLAGLAATRLK